MRMLEKIKRYMTNIQDEVLLIYPKISRVPKKRIMEYIGFDKEYLSPSKYMKASKYRYDDIMEAIEKLDIDEFMSRLITNR